MAYRVPDPQRTAEADRARERERAEDAEVIAAMRRGSPRPRSRWVRRLGAFFVVGVGALPLLFVLAVLVAPPMSREHPVMPIGQAGFALISAPVVGLVAGWLAGRPRT
jgi:hypothetical protein